MKTIRTWINKGYNIEVYIDGKLVDWRCGLTKAGFNSYLKYYNETGYLSRASMDYVK
jgi:hypothetical protein